MDKFYRPCAMIEFDEAHCGTSQIAQVTESLLKRWPGCKRLVGFMPVFASRRDAETFFTERGQPIGEIGEIEYED